MGLNFLVLLGYRLHVIIKHQKTLTKLSNSKAFLTERLL